MATSSRSRDDFSIVVIDGACTVQGGLDWQGLDSLGLVTFYPVSEQSQVHDRVQSADAVITNKIAFRAEQLQKLPRLKYVGVSATGFDIIDVQSARDLGIAVTNVPAYSTDSVAQHVFALILSYYSKIALYAGLSRSGAWSRSPEFCLIDAPTVELRGKTIGVIGFGSIGQRVAAIAEAFGMRVLVMERTAGAQNGRVPLELLLAEADIVTLHCPLTTETKGMVNSAFLNKMKRDALLINTSRGGLINESDLVEMLNNGVIAHAALDVLGKEPPIDGHPLIQHAATTITPHIAWATFEARQRLVNECIRNLEAFRQGIRQNRVD